jgi:hypothetical protein
MVDEEASPTVEGKAAFEAQSTDNKDDLLVLKSMLVLVQKKRCHFDLQLKLVGE